MLGTEGPQALLPRLRLIQKKSRYLAIYKKTTVLKATAHFLMASKKGEPMTNAPPADIVSEYCGLNANKPASGVIGIAFDVETIGERVHYKKSMRASPCKNVAA